MLTTRLRTVKFKVEETNETFSDKMQAYTIELPCLQKDENECTEDLEYWTYILNNMENCQTQLPFVAKKPFFGKIGELASLAKMPSADREKYQRSLDQYRSIAATYAYEREQGIDQGRKLERNVLIEKLRKKGMSEEEINELLK